VTKIEVEIKVDPDELAELTIFRPYGKPFSVSLFIREKLKIIGRGYPYELWLEWRKLNEEFGYKYCTYGTFRRYIWELKTLGLIRFKLPTKKPVRGQYRRRYYELVPELIDALAWYDPHGTLIKLRGWVGRKG